MNPQAIYIESDIPPGMTCAEYRRRRIDEPRRQARLSRFRRLLRRPA